MILLVAMILGVIMMWNGSQVAKPTRRFLPIATATILFLFGLSVLAFSLLSHLMPSDSARVTITLRLQGQGQRPIEGAEVWLTRPTLVKLGATDRAGVGVFETEIPKGKVAVVEARGATFKAHRQFLVPHLNEYAISVAIDPWQAALGTAHIDSITKERRDSQALEAYSKALSSQANTRSQLAEGLLAVTLAKSDEQPPLNENERIFLSKVRGAVERTLPSMQYSLLSRKAHLVDLRLLRGGTSVFLEFRIFNTSQNLIGSRLVDAPTLKPKMLASVLSEALQGPLTMLEPKGAETTRLMIQKRPIDDLIVYRNGRQVETQVTHDRVVAPMFLATAPQQAVQLAAAGRSGVLVVKEFKSGALPKVLEWTWPEWHLSQRSNE
jgi:hypothetical protein